MHSKFTHPRISHADCAINALAWLVKTVDGMTRRSTTLAKENGANMKDLQTLATTAKCITLQHPEITGQSPQQLKYLSLLDQLTTTLTCGPIAILSLNSYDTHPLLHRPAKFNREIISEITAMTEQNQQSGATPRMLETLLHTQTPSNPRAVIRGQLQQSGATPRVSGAISRTLTPPS